MNNMKPKKDIFVLCKLTNGEFRIAKWVSILNIWIGQKTMFILNEKEVSNWEYLNK